MNQCHHGQLARSCERCEDAAEIERLRAALAYAITAADEWHDECRGGGTIKNDSNMDAARALLGSPATVLVDVAPEMTKAANAALDRAERLHRAALDRNMDRLDSLPEHRRHSYDAAYSAEQMRTYAAQARLAIRDALLARHKQAGGAHNYYACLAREIDEGTL